MKISLVIPVFNEEKYIKDCLISAVTQKEPFDEIIVVDNNCTDNTIAIAKQFPVTIVTEKKQGMISARNRGFDSVKNDIIARCDADTRLAPNWTIRIRENFTNRKIDALTGTCIFYDLKLKTSFFSNFYLDVVKPILNGNEVLIGPNMVLTKDIWNRVRKKVCLNDKRVHEDIDLAIHITDQKGKIARDTKLVVYISGRRIRKNPVSFFAEYPVRFMKTLFYHKKDLVTPFLVGKTMI